MIQVHDQIGQEHANSIQRPICTAWFHFYAWRLGCPAAATRVRRRITNVSMSICTMTKIYLDYIDVIAIE